MSDAADDYDSPWKEAIERYFADFMHFYFPAAHARIDWRKPPVFLDKELQAVIRDAASGKRFVDKLARVTGVEGQQEWIYLHLEVQGERQQEFAERMFVYHYRLYDRYRQPIASFALLADDRADWRPEHFHYDVLGCRLGLRFPVAKLLDWTGSEARLEDSDNPFAVLTRAHLANRSTRDDMDSRYRIKWRLVQSLYRRGWDKQRVIDLFHVLDWMMRLPDELECRLWNDLQHWEEEVQMRYVNSVERIGMAKGMEQGIQQGIQRGIQRGQARLLARQLERRFGLLPDELRARLDQATNAELEAWADAVLSARTLAEVFGADRH